MNIIPDRIVTLVDRDDDGYSIAEGSAWEVETPTGTELAPLGWDEDDTVIIDEDELKRLLAPTMQATCEVTFRRNSRPELNLVLTVT